MLLACAHPLDGVYHPHTRTHKKPSHSQSVSCSPRPRQSSHCLTHICARTCTGNVRMHARPRHARMHNARRNYRAQPRQHAHTMGSRTNVYIYGLNENACACSFVINTACARIAVKCGSQSVLLHTHTHTHSHVKVHMDVVVARRNSTIGRVASRPVVLGRFLVSSSQSNPAMNASWYIRWYHVELLLITYVTMKELERRRLVTFVALFV